MIAQRITSLAKVARLTAETGELGDPLRDFLDGFYAFPSARRVKEEPQRLEQALGDSGLADAYLAAIADHLSRQFGFRAPAWTRDEGRALKYPYFAARTHALRMILLQESPSAFRERNVFVSANALSRA
jgi:hypothetical protein